MTHGHSVTGSSPFRPSLSAHQSMICEEPSREKLDPQHRDLRNTTVLVFQDTTRCTFEHIYLSIADAGALAIIAVDILDVPGQSGTYMFTGLPGRSSCPTAPPGRLYFTRAHDLDELMLATKVNVPLLEIGRVDGACPTAHQRSRRRGRRTRTTPPRAPPARLRCRTRSEQAGSSDRGGDGQGAAGAHDAAGLAEPMEGHV